MIGISTIEYDIDSGIILKTARITGGFQLSRRSSFAENLDGSISITDDGFFYPGQTFNFIVENITQTEYNELSRVFKTYNTLVVACEFGVFECSINQLSIDDGDATASCIIKQNLT